MIPNRITNNRGSTSANSTAATPLDNLPALPFSPLGRCIFFDPWMKPAAMLNADRKSRQEIRHLRRRQVIGSRPFGLSENPKIRVREPGSVQIFGTMAVSGFALFDPRLFNGV